MVQGFGIRRYKRMQGLKVSGLGLKRVWGSVFAGCGKTVSVARSIMCHPPCIRPIGKPASLSLDMVVVVLDVVMVGSVAVVVLVLVLVLRCCGVAVLRCVGVVVVLWLLWLLL